MKVTLTVIAGPNLGKSFSFDGHDTFIVGRGSKAHLQLPAKDKYFSRHHFLLEVNPPLCRLTDLESSNGTFVNGQRVNSIDLKHADVIVGGDTSIRVAIEPAAEAVVAATVNEQLPRELVPTAATRRETIREAGVPADAGNEATVDLQPNLSLASPVIAKHPGAIETDRAGKTDEPQRHGEFILLRKIGAGGMGAVHLAQHCSTGEICAVKTIIAGAATSERAVQRFLREAAILQKLRHPHIVEYRDLGHAGDQVFFAMEYVDGIDAAQLLKREGPLSVARAVGWICQLLLALEYAHREKFVHRDIKPANLLISRQNGREYLKLADFGLARVYHASTLSGLTMDGDVGGSLPFMPPEQITHYRNVDPRSDLYSVAATLYTLLCGKTPYELPKKAAERMKLILQSQPVSLQPRRPELPPTLCEIIDKTLSREPADRYENAARMRQALMPFVA
jgi:pSer/pThr/pTyr-binding forkhead associated (FHA) protein